MGQYWDNNEMIVMLFLPLLEEKFFNVNNLTLNLKAQTNLEFIKSFKAMNLTAIFSRNSIRERQLLENRQKF